MPKAAQSKELENFDIFDVIGNGDASKEYDMMEEEQTELLKRLISELPEEQREVLMMRHYEDLSFKEISEKTGVSINTSLGRMRYALINIRKLMVEHNVDLMIN
jgi:RNA polymerase sigma-70 factor (ECF subfamily)